VAKGTKVHIQLWFGLETDMKCTGFMLVSKPVLVGGLGQTSTTQIPWLKTKDECCTGMSLFTYQSGTGIGSKADFCLVWGGYYLWSLLVGYLYKPGIASGDTSTIYLSCSLYTSTTPVKTSVGWLLSLHPVIKLTILLLYNQPNWELPDIEISKCNNLPKLSDYHPSRLSIFKH
jgi:hypothetical protein